ncbi:NAD(P)-binding protein [Herbaspirillum sp. RTI4]|uniref:NAD(P)/FAD-dependent oxidoreductase n=1 Tax=Herbaspirillum sp. RTI4 TaxID=3048640 RepID=UPI002AB44631|nr:FAD-dependent oxidoreductase [Herbaspirillum sp. RTI4]MDY7577831.1 NAD(P)-binding protein [Herbaspirillum sp. RTI4]MEA9982449.1 NAD(P)-binding protein [Herbaspirillum sp. RTI4]
MTPTLHFAVIGAGLAGLSCAAALQKAGVQISVFEKSRGPSGRMSTRRSDDGQCDHGAQYFTARSPAFSAEVARWKEAGVAALWTPKLHAYDGKTTTPMNSSIERFVGVPAMNSAAGWLAKTLTVCAGITVRQLHPHSDGWQIESAEEGLLDTHFDAVILAIPAPQAAALLPQSATALAAIATSATMRPCWSLMLRFDEPIGLPFDAAFVNQGPLRWVARDTSKPGRSGKETWLLHATAEWSEAHLEQAAGSIAADLLAAFSQLGGTVPHTWTAHRWLYASTESAVAGGCAWQADAGLGLCGDWLHGGKVEGAWLSGQALARKMVESFGLPLDVAS